MCVVSSFDSPCGLTTEGVFLPCQACTMIIISWLCDRLQLLANDPPLTSEAPPVTLFEPRRLVAIVDLGPDISPPNAAATGNVNVNDNNNNEIDGNGGGVGGGGGARARTHALFKLLLSQDSAADAFDALLGRLGLQPAVSRDRHCMEAGIKAMMGRAMWFIVKVGLVKLRADSNPHVRGDRWVARGGAGIVQVSCAVPLDREGKAIERFLSGHETPFKEEAARRLSMRRDRHRRREEQREEEEDEMRDQDRPRKKAVAKASSRLDRLARGRPQAQAHALVETLAAPGMSTHLPTSASSKRNDQRQRLSTPEAQHGLDFMPMSMPIMPSTIRQYAPVPTQQPQQPLLPGHPPSQNHLGSQFYHDQFGGYGDMNMHEPGHKSGVVGAGPESDNLPVTLPLDANLVDTTTANTTNQSRDPIAGQNSSNWGWHPPAELAASSGSGGGSTVGHGGVDGSRDTPIIIQDRPARYAPSHPDPSRRTGEPTSHSSGGSSSGSSSYSSCLSQGGGGYGDATSYTHDRRRDGPGYPIDDGLGFPPTDGTAFQVQNHHQDGRQHRTHMSPPFSSGGAVHGSASWSSLPRSSPLSSLDDTISPRLLSLNISPPPPPQDRLQHGGQGVRAFSSRDGRQDHSHGHHHFLQQQQQNHHPDSHIHQNAPAHKLSSYSPPLLPSQTRTRALFIGADLLPTPGSSDTKMD